MPYESVYERLYGKSPYSLDILRPRTEKKSWYQLSPVEKQQELERQKTKLTEISEVPPHMKRRRLKDAFKPMLNTLQVIGGVLNVPSASISGAVKQLVDGAPGFDAQEYFRDVFKLKEQVSWRDVIGILAERDEDKNMWDRKGVQIAFGLTLDIVLDPLTYFGAGAVKSISGKSARELTERMFKMLANVDPHTANRIARNVQNSFQRVWGLQVPWKPLKVAKPILGKRSKALTEILERAGKIPRTPLAQEHITKEAIRLGKKMTPLQKLTDWMWKTPIGKGIESAFMPRRAQKLPIFFAKINRQHNKEFATKEMWTFVKKLSREGKLDHTMKRRLTDILWTMPYVDKEVLEHYNKVAYDTNKLIRAYVQGRDIDKTVRNLAKRNELFGMFYKSRLKEMLKAKDVPPAKIIEAMGDMYDKTSALQAKIMLEQAGFKNAGDLETLAKLKPEIDFETVFKKLGKELTQNQKESVMHIIGTHRETLDYWLRKERTLGIPVKYKRDYISKATGAMKMVGVPRELGGRAGFTFKQWNKLSPVERFDALVKRLVETGAARNANHAKLILKQGRIKSIGTVVETFDEALWLRGQAHTKAIHKAKFIEDVKQYGTYAGRAKLEGMQGVKGVDELKGYLFDEDTARVINNVISVAGDDKGMSMMLKGIDQTQGWWRGMVTIMNPGFVMRNKYTNNAIGIFENSWKWFTPGVHKQARVATLEALFPDNKAVWKFFEPWGIKKSVLDEPVRGFPSMKVRDLVQPLIGEGNIRRGMRITDKTMMAGMEDVLKMKKKILKRLNPTTPEFAVAKVMEAYAGLTESHARVANTILGLQKYGDLKTAARRTQEFFVEYGAKTTVERAVVGRAIPFFQWLKQNTANQVKYVFTLPGRYSKLPEIVGALEAGTDKIPEEWKPEYFREMWAWQLPITLPSGHPLFLNPNFQFQDLNKLDPSVWTKTVLTSITPFAKVPLELMTGYEWYRKKPIERYPGYKAPVPGILQSITKMLPKGVKDKLKIEQDARGRYVMNPKAAHAITNLLPFVNNTARMMMQEPTAIPSDRYFKWISYMFGIKIKPVDTLTQEYYATKDKITKRREELRKLGIEY